jgi:DNA topoisomerase-1
MSKLIIVESPGKIKKIKSIVGNDYIVLASCGHFRDLDKSSLSIDIDDNFKPTYVFNTDKKSVISNIKKNYTKDTELIIASDGDREGEAIGYHLLELLKPKTYKRIIFYSITKREVNEALEKPTKINMNVVNAQQARRLLDRIVGYELSPILHRIPALNNIKTLGTGRVQSVVTKLIVEKENEIKEHLDKLKESEYEIQGYFKINGKDIVCDLKYRRIEELSLQITNNNIKYVDIPLNELDVESILKIVMKYPEFKITNIDKKNRFRHPPQPFITTSLQKDCSYKFRLPIIKTMKIAQKLYELGLITYMRTDSPSLSDESLGNIKKYILGEETLGNKYYKFRQFKSKNTSAQEAHEAIRPSNINVYDLSDYDLLDTIEEKIYQLIWKRTVASQMTSAELADTIITLNNKKHVCFIGTTTIQIFDGFLKIYSEADNEDNDKKNTDKIIDLQLFDNFDKNNVTWNDIIGTQKFKNPPVRYSEATLVEKLEKLNIGRPATYASMISKIQEHNYVNMGTATGIEKNINILTLSIKKMDIIKKINKKMIGNEKNKLMPTETGKIVTEYLDKYFPDIIDYKFTANMEKDLDEISEGKLIWNEQVLRKFYDIFKKSLDNFKIKMNENKETINLLPDVEIIGKYTNNQDIFYLISKYGPTIKVKIDGNYVYANFKNKPSLNDAIIGINKKIEWQNNNKNNNKNNKNNNKNNKNNKYDKYNKDDNK